LFDFEQPLPPVFPAGKGAHEPGRDIHICRCGKAGRRGGMMSQALCHATVDRWDGSKSLWSRCPPVTTQRRRQATGSKRCAAPSRPPPHPPAAPRGCPTRHLHFRTAVAIAPSTAPQRLVTIICGMGVSPVYLTGWKPVPRYERLDTCSWGALLRGCLAAGSSPKTDEPASDFLSPGLGGNSPIPQVKTGPAVAIGMRFVQAGGLFSSVRKNYSL